MNDGGALVIGYGNPLRGDDGFGCSAAGLLAADPRLDGATVLGRHQLTPELATDIAGASLVGGAAFTDDDRLSLALQRVLPEVVERVARVVQEHGHR